MDIYKGDTICIDSLISSKRKIQKVIVPGLKHFRKNKLLELSEFHGHNIRELLLRNCVFEKIDQLLELLNTMPNVQKVILFETCIVDEEEFVDIKLPELKELKTIEMIESEYKILGAFKKAKISTFKVLSGIKSSVKVLSGLDVLYQVPQSYKVKQLKQLKCLNDFLSKQEHIETMALRSFDNNDMHMFSHSIPMETVPFRLKRLSLLDMNLDNQRAEKHNFEDFMKIHSEKLEELELGRTFPESIFEFVFRKFENLKTLRLIGSNIPRRKDFYEGLARNESIRSFVITDHEAHIKCEELIKFMRHMPGIQSLKLNNSCEGNILIPITGFFEQLTHLSLSSLSHANQLHGLQFHALTSLHIKLISATIDWDFFTQSNPTVKSLEILQIRPGSFVDFEAITLNWKLETLILRNCIDYDTDFFDIIRKNCLHLKTLVLNKSHLKVDVSDVADIRGLRFTEELEPYWQCVKTVFWEETNYYRGLPRGYSEWEYFESIVSSSDSDADSDD